MPNESSQSKAHLSSTTSETGVQQKLDEGSKETITVPVQQEAVQAGSVSGDEKSPAPKKRAFILGGILVALVAVGVFAAFAIVGLGKANLMHPGGYDTSKIQLAKGATSPDGGRTVTYNDATYKLNEEMVAICVMGNDKGLHTPGEGFNGQADAIMVFALNTKTNDITVIAGPRDCMVSSTKKFRETFSQYKTDKMQLCLTFAYGADNHESSKLVASRVSELLYGIPLDFYYTLETDGIGQLADIAGGVTLQALYDVPVTAYSTDMPIKAGEVVTLRGKDALRYVQYRDTSRYETALERLDRQQQFVKELGKTLLQRVKNSPSVAVDIYNTLQGYSTTNLGAAEFSYLATAVSSTQAQEVTIKRLQGTAVHNSDNPWEQFLVDEDSTYQLVLDTFYTKMESQ